MNETSAISPAPWQSVEPAINPINQPPMCSILSADGRVVATVYQRGESEEGAANLRLLRTAPELLEELKHLLRVLGPLEDTGKLDGHGFATFNSARLAVANASA